MQLINILQSYLSSKNRIWCWSVCFSSDVYIDTSPSTTLDTLWMRFTNAWYLLTCLLTYHHHD